MMVPSYLPDSLAIKDILSQLGLVGSLGLLCVAMALSIDKNGESILDIGKGVVEGVPWGLIFMLAAAMVISPMIVSDDTGISVAILNILNPIVSGMNSTVFIAFMVIIGMILTNCVNNMVVASLLIPISIPILESNGGSIPLMVALFSMTLTQGIVMPGGSALGAMLHGQKEWLKSTMVYKYATVMMLFLAIVISVIGIFVGNYIFSVL